MAHEASYGSSIGDRVGVVWRLKVPEKLKVFVCLLLHDATPVNPHRFRCNLTNSPSCSRCSHGSEDSLHCLRDLSPCKGSVDSLKCISLAGVLILFNSDVDPVADEGLQWHSVFYYRVETLAMAQRNSSGRQAMDDA